MRDIEEILGIGWQSMSTQEFNEAFFGIEAEKEEFKARYQECEKYCCVLKEEKEELKKEIEKLKKELESKKWLNQDKEEKLKHLRGKTEAYEFVIERMYGKE